MVPPTAADMRLPSAMEEAGLIYMVPSDALEVPEGQEGSKTWARVGTLVKVLWAVEVKLLLVMTNPFKVVVPVTVRVPKTLVAEPEEPKLMVVAVVGRMLKVVAVVVRSPPAMAASPVTVSSLRVLVPPVWGKSDRKS